MATNLGTGPRLAWRTILLGLVALPALAAAPGDRKAPTTPTDLRVTGVYATRNGVNTFAVAAIDSAGNRSELSNELSGSFNGCEF